eukprot:1185457-Prorocentrum_minimum.AAC.5
MLVREQVATALCIQYNGGVLDIGVAYRLRLRPKTRSGQSGSALLVSFRSAHVPLYSTRPTPSCPRNEKRGHAALTCPAAALYLAWCAHAWPSGEP